MNSEGRAGPSNCISPRSSEVATNYIDHLDSTFILAVEVPRIGKVIE
jgi:hypothetical protein